MLTITREQIGLLALSAFQRYQRGLIPHILDHFPGHAEYLGEQGILRVIQHGCALAEKHGFESQRDLCLYTDLTIMLGSGFDSDPQLEWAREILQDPTLVDPRSRMDDLWEQAMNYLERVLGPRDIFPRYAYRAARKHRVARTRNVTATDENSLISYFHDIWPEKARYVGASALADMIDKSRESAARHRIRHDLGQVEFAIHAFLFGHLFHEDPLYPWVDDILRSDDVLERQDRVRRMVDAFDAHLQGVLG